jgi:predicted DNA-binding protein YlxM (UPF0122 family)
MEIKDLKRRSELDAKKKLNKIYSQFLKLLNELKTKKLPDNIVNTINTSIDEINSITETNKAFGKRVKKTQSRILQLIEKELHIVTKNHYRNTWLIVGISAFGIPIGLVLGRSTDNMGLIGAGLSIGMAIGMVIGSELDKKALKDGKQLEFEVYS